jgi:glycosyltransferase involved in cell wall biosynthesis
MRRRVRRRRIHLLEVAVRWPPETFLCWKLEALAREGLRVTVASPAAVCDRSARLEGVRMRRIPEWSETRREVVLGILRDGLALLVRSPARLVRLVGAVRRSGRRDRWDALAALRSFLPLARMRADVVHFEWNGAAVHYLPLLEVWRSPAVVSCHGGEVTAHPHQPGAERFANTLSEIFRRADVVHCVSEATRREAMRYGLDPGRTALIRSAVDPGFFHPPPGPRPSRDALRITSVSWLRWLKGHEYSLQALRLLLDRGVPFRYDVLGSATLHSIEESPEVQRIRYTIEDLGLSDRVVLHGRVSPAEVKARLHESDVLLLSSLTEGLPTVILEAMACELPVVATDIGGTREAVTDGVEGFVVPARAPEQLADALERLWRSPDLRTAMGAAGRERVRSSFGLDDQVRRFAALYAQLGANGAGP